MTHARTSLGVVLGGLLAAQSPGGGKAAAARAAPPTSGQVFASPDRVELIHLVNHRWRNWMLAQWPEKRCMSAQYRPPELSAANMYANYIGAQHDNKYDRHSLMDIRSYPRHRLGPRR